MLRVGGHGWEEGVECVTSGVVAHTPAMLVRTRNAEEEGWRVQGPPRLCGETLFLRGGMRKP